MEYKNIKATIEYNNKNDMFYGETNINGEVIVFNAKDPVELELIFEEIVDDYFEE